MLDLMVLSCSGSSIIEVGGNVPYMVKLTSAGQSKSMCRPIAYPYFLLFT